MKAILETVANEFWTKKKTTTKKSKFLFHPDLLCSFLSIVLIFWEAQRIVSVLHEKNI